MLSFEGGSLRMKNEYSTGAGKWARKHIIHGSPDRKRIKKQHVNKQMNEGWEYVWIHNMHVGISNSLPK